MANQIIETTMSLMERSHRSSTIVQYLSKFEVVVCTECGYVLNKPPGISNHLISVHSWCPFEAKAVDQQFVTNTIRSPCDTNCTWIFPRPEDSSLPYLPTCDNGFGCHICSFVCRSISSIQNHYSLRHRDESHSKPLKELYRTKVHVQWFTNGGPHRQCFEINRGINAKPVPVIAFNDTAA